MNERKPVLADHKRKGSKLVTPFNDQLGPIREVSWINTILPELLWISLIQDHWGPHRCVEILTAFTRDIRDSNPDRADTVWAAAGKFYSIPAEEIRELVQRRDALYGDDIRAALRPLAAWYPDHPLNKIFPVGEIPAKNSDLQQIKRVVTELFDRSSWLATMTQAHAVWLAFDSGRLKVAPGLYLAQFPQIDQYPETELSRRIASSIRSSLNAFFGGDGLMTSNSRWPIEFWNHGLILEPCEVGLGNR